MAKEVRNVSFTKAVITKSTEGNWCITEVDKDALRSYNLDEVLNSWTGLRDVSLTLKQGVDIEPDEEDI